MNVGCNLSSEIDVVPKLCISHHQSISYSSSKLTDTSTKLVRITLILHTNIHTCKRSMLNCLQSSPEWGLIQVWFFCHLDLIPVLKFLTMLKVVTITNTIYFEFSIDKYNLVVLFPLYKYNFLIGNWYLKTCVYLWIIIYIWSRNL